jgi:hypothetical protein
MCEQWILPVARTEWLPVGPSGRVLALEHFTIDLDVLLQVRRNVLFGEDRRYRALRLARAAIDALVGMDVQLVRSLIDAVHGTYIYASAVLRILAGFSYDVRHLFSDSAAAPSWALECFLCEK